MARITTEGKITIEITKNERLENAVTLITKEDHKTLDTITLADTYYENDTVSLLKNLMGECIQAIKDLSSEAGMIEAVEDELDNYNTKYTVVLED